MHRGEKERIFFLKQWKIRLIPDSPRWMVQNGRIDKAAEILRKSAKTNDLEIPKDLIVQLQLEAAKRFVKHNYNKNNHWKWLSRL